MVIVFLKILFALLIWIICIITGWALTETKFRIAQIEAFDFKPLNCKKCFTFWLTTAMALITVFVFNQPLSGIIIGVLAVLTALAMHIEDKKWIEK